MTYPIERQTLVPVGNAMRLPAVKGAGVSAVLVIDHTPASRAWLTFLALAQSAAIRHFVTTADLAELATAGHVPVVPGVAPAFLVAVGGFFVDAFPVPASGPGEATDPTALVRAVEERLESYA